MSDRANGTTQRRLLLGALVCAVLLSMGYVAFVSTAWGHQVDGDAYFGRQALGRNVIKVDLDLLDLASKAALLLAAAVLLIVTAVRRCALVGVLAVAGFGGAVVGALRCPKACSRGERWWPRTPSSRADYRPPPTQAATRPWAPRWL
jgi:hypothetical protein